MFNKGEIFRKIEFLAEENSNEKTGRFDLHAVQEQLAVFLDEHRIDIDVVRLAVDYVNEFDRKQRPKGTKSAQGIFNFYDENAWIPTGNKERVIMKMATRLDVVAWAQIEISEYAASAKAHANKMEYINSRLTAWSKNCRTLGQLETTQFGDQAA